MTNDSFESENELLRKFPYNSSIKGAASLLYFHRKGVTQKLLHKLKYEGQFEIGRLLGAWFSDQIEGLQIDYIIPVPIHKTKQRKRGYNQSTEIALGIHENLGLDLREDIIKRDFQSLSQTKKSKVQRWEALENVYSEASEAIRDCKVLVVDDVITTGATIGMLCERLSDKGVGEIYIGSIARGQ